MNAAKKSVTFYAAKDVAAWLASFDQDENVSSRINEAIREGALRQKTKALFQIPFSFYEMSTLLEVLKQEYKRRERLEDEVDGDDIASAREHAAEVARLLSHIESFVK